MRDRTSRGFTLVELLVVVFIIAALAAIAVPMYGTYLRQGAAKEGEAIAEAVMSAEKTYRQRRGVWWTDFSSSQAVRDALGVNVNEAQNFTVTAVPSGTQLVVTATGKEGSGAAGITVTLTHDTSTGSTSRNVSGI